MRLPGAVEQEIVEIYVSPSELAKSYAKVALACSVERLDCSNKKHVGMFINMTWNDLLQSTPEWAKKMKNPVVDFGALRGLCNDKARKFLGL